MNIAFYAPLKAPDHAVPSGDRTMARALLAALEKGGMAARIVSRLRSFERSPSEAALARLEIAAATERDRLCELFAEQGDWRPDVWLTYHPYYKSPDLIGPPVARALGIPYATAEASFSARRATGAWAIWHQANLPALEQAAAHFVMTSRDKSGLEKCPGLSGRLVDLPPFIDLDDGAADEPTSHPAMSAFDEPVRLIVVAMMRADVKLKSYQMLADALGRIADLDWSLEIIGDGAAGAQVEAAFAAALGEKVHAHVNWCGECCGDEIRRRLSQADVFVWPGYDEAFGLAYLEAQAAGLPVVAQQSGGIAAVVKAGQTGLLTPEGDLDAYCNALRTMIANRRMRNMMGQAARQFVRTERTTAHAAEILRGALMEFGSGDA